MLSKLTSLHIHLIGFFMALIVAGLLFGFVIKPKNEEITKTKAETTSLLTTDHGSEAQQHKQDLVKAKADAVKTDADWKVASADYMPNLNFTNNVFNGYDDTLTKLPRAWGTYMAAWYDAQRNLGVVRTPGVDFPIPSLSTDPNYVSTDVKNITFPDRGKTWSVQVEAKSFDALMAHLRRFNTKLKGHGMPVINNVALSGQSPNLVATYDLALYVITPTPLPAANPKVGSGAPAGGAGGGGGVNPRMAAMMGGGGMSGGPPGGMGGGGSAAAFGGKSAK